MTEYIWPLTVLIIFGGMLAIVWRALTIAHDLAKIVLQGGGQLPSTKSIIPNLPSIVKPQPTPPISTKPVEVVDQGLVDFIKKTEGFSPKAYWDYKQYSIGYGTKANSASEVIDEHEAEARLATEINKAWESVKKILPPNTPLGIEQALTDLTYNAGSGWEEHGLGAAVKAGNWAEAKTHLLEYNHAGGEVSTGLTNRRKAEVSWFDSPL